MLDNEKATSEAQEDTEAAQPEQDVEHNSVVE